MSVDQTNQLIQLILNALLLSIVCGAMVGVTSVRVQWVLGQLRGIQIELRADSWQTQRQHWGYLSQQRRSLRHSYRWERLAQLAAHYALLLAVVSTLVVSMRSLVNWNELIVVSFVFFAASAGILLISILCVLVMLHKTAKTPSIPLGNGVSGNSLSSEERKMSIPVAAFKVPS